MMSPPAPADEATSAPPWTIACMNLPLTWVDDLMEAVVPRCAVAHRWIAFSEDMRRLGALATHWDSEANLVVVMLAEPLRHMQEAALGVMEAERVTMERCIWLQGKSIRVPPQGVAPVFVGHKRQVEDAAAQILRLLSVAPALPRRG
jgi:hypothetical protein